MIAVDWTGLNRQGRSVGGRICVLDVPLFVESLFCRRYQSVVVLVGAELVGCIERDAQGRRIWWAES